MAVSIPTNRVANEAGKGIEALRMAMAHLIHTVAGSQSLVAIVGPFDVDIDVRKIVATSGLVPADNASNLLTVYNGLVASNKPIGTLNFHTSLFTLQVPVAVPVTANQRVIAGTPICVLGTFAGSDAAAGAVVSVAIFYEIPLSDPSANAVSYGAYNAGYQN